MFDVQELNAESLPFILDYWYSRTESQMITMGADINKMPSRDNFQNLILDQINKPYKDKKGYALLWLYNGKPIGHNNINKIKYNLHGYMHLHIWSPQKRQRGLGQQLLKKSIPFFFKNFRIKYLLCEPYALNPAPNKTLPKLGFEFVKKYETIPGSINFKQEVNQWVLTKDIFEKNF